MTERQTTFDVKIWKITSRKNKKGETFRVRWLTAGHEQHDTFPSYKAADSFRSKLVTASREGEPFEIERPGLPASMWTPDQAPEVSWFDHACAWTDLAWRRGAPGTRSNTASSLAVVTAGLFTADPGTGTSTDPAGFDPADVRWVLRNWMFNIPARLAGPPEDEHHAEIAAWLATHTEPVAALGDPDRLRDLIAHCATTVTGRAAGRKTQRSRLEKLNQVLNYAVERGLVATNHLPRLRKENHHRSTERVSPRSVVNPTQARTLLDAVARRHHHLAAFFGLLYYGALRPSEAVDIRETDLKLPENGWGEAVLKSSAPQVDPEWHDDDATRPRESRSLKHRAPEEIRRVPLHPRLVTLLQDHLDRHGTDHAGRLFRARTGGPLMSGSYRCTWNLARRDALTPAQYDSPLAKSPYDLRHAGVSFWLNSREVGPTQAAAWAGHSVDTLLRIYASCIEGQQDAALRGLLSAYDQYDDATRGGTAAA